MNIIIQTDNGYCCRPDTTWERENRDFYSPDLIKDLSFSPILFARISKAGKCIGRKFAHRYYDAVNYGILLYAENLIGTDVTGFVSASMIDHTSILPYPMYDRCVLEEGTNEYIISLNGENVFRTSAGEVRMIEDAISEASRLISLRIGDHIAIELAGRSILPGQAEGGDRLCGTFCANSLFDFKIVR